MKGFKRIFYYFVIIVSTIVILASLLSLFYDLPYWYSKILDFPRLQYLILGVVCVLLFLGLNKRWKLPSYLLVLGLLAAIYIHSVRIFPYWFGDKAVPDAPAAYNEKDGFSVMLANVLIKNKEYDRFLELVVEQDPDMLLAMEVDQKWVEQLQVLNNDYPHVISRPNDEAYGMILYSKLPLRKQEVKYLKHKFVPSFHADVELPSGKSFRLHAVHPVAPVPSDKYPDNKGEQEVELLKVGEMVADDQLPSIVAGDFNDVSWSHTARLFGHDGQLKNVRIGRGLYNSFDATSMVMRWPLDHYFVTEEFEVVELERLQEFGSDHFPVYARFVLK
ncbi:MAG: endonuclease/exonuclease/phosphatase family protein [Salinimicrobium sp.]